MSTSCNILFENPKEVYYSGEMLRGTIYLTLTAPSMTMPSPPNLPDSKITSFHSMVRCLPIFICFIHFENIYACFFYLDLPTYEKAMEIDADNKNNFIKF